TQSTQHQTSLLDKWLAKPGGKTPSGQQRPAGPAAKEQPNTKGSASSSSSSIIDSRIEGSGVGSHSDESDIESKILDKFTESIHRFRFGNEDGAVPKETGTNATVTENALPDDVSKMIEEAFGSPPVYIDNKPKRRRYSATNRQSVTKRSRRMVAISSEDEDEGEVEAGPQRGSRAKNTSPVSSLFSDPTSPVASAPSTISVPRPRRLYRGSKAIDAPAAVLTPAESESLADAGTDSDEESVDGQTYSDTIDAAQATLDMFNNGTVDELMAKVEATEEEARIIAKELRPFEDLDDIEARIRRAKGVRLSLFTGYHVTMKGYMVVDRVIQQCNQVADQVRSAMLRAGMVVDEQKGTIELKEGVQLKGPKSFNPEFSLKGYQLEGMSWLTCLFESSGSGILADEMGLGKTCQVITFIANVLERGSSGPFMVICPSSTIENWINEFRKFAPTLRVESYYGSQKERMYRRAHIDRSEWDVLVTTYNIATCNKVDRIFLKNYQFSALILDEGHMVKNCTSARYNWLMQIKSGFRLLLTGTPLQNNLQELISLLSFIMPRVFQDSLKDLQQAFKSRSTKSAAPAPSIRKSAGSAASRKRSQQADADNDDTESVQSAETPVSSASSSVQGEISILEKERINRAKHLLAPFVLRRRKIDVLSDLPKKTEQVVYVELDAGQKDLYEDLKSKFTAESNGLAMMVPRLSGLNGIAELEDAAAGPLLSPQRLSSSPRCSGAGDPSAKKQPWVTSLMELRKVANHPLLVRSYYTKDKLCEMARALMKEPDYVEALYEYLVEDMEVCSDYDLHKYCVHYKRLHKYQLPEHLFMNVGKIRQLRMILDKAEESGEKVLVFSQFTTMLDILEKVLKDWEILYSRLDGSTKVGERQDIIDDFNNDDEKRVFLLSTKAGGFGINLTSASIVVIHDIDFNPHNDRQAEDRAHRVGQQKDVTVYKLIGKGTIEEDILEQAKAKLLLDESISRMNSALETC
ncbi:DNA-dependent ATPase fun30, partial [Spiromyces aspiralis]